MKYSRPSQSARRHEIVIAVMGVTGAGKSTFIKTITGIDSIEVGHDLKSCTNSIESYTFQHENFQITLVDTPGFNDTVRSETEVLKDISSWLAHSYKNENLILTGILYLHALERRMYGSSLRNLKMFRDLCGDNPLKNVLLVTTGWTSAEKAGELVKAEKNEAQLRDDPAFWEPMIRRGSTLVRFEDTRESALEIVMSLVDRQPTILQIQDELVNQHLNLVDTSAGHAVNEEAKRLEQKYKAELVQIQQEMDEALAARDSELQEALNESKLKIEKLRDDARLAQEQLEYDRRNEKREHDNEIQNLRMHMEFQQERAAKELELRLREQRLEDKIQFEELAATLRANSSRLRDEERKALEEKIEELEQKKKEKRRGAKLLLWVAKTIGGVALSTLGIPTILLGLGGM